MEEIMDIGERIRFVRKLKGMTQMELAEKVGLGNDDNARTRISQYENGIRTPKEETLEKISEALGVTSLYLSTKDRTYAYDVCMFLFEIDNLSNIKIKKEDEETYWLDINYTYYFKEMYDEWMKKKSELEQGLITKEEYIMWKINYGSHKK